MPLFYNTYQTVEDRDYQFDELPHPLELRLLRDKDCPAVAFCMQKQPSI